MGCHCGLTVQKLEIISTQNNVVAMELFRPSDKKVTIDSIEDGIIYEYRAPVAIVIDRLLAMGYSIEDAKTGLQEYISELTEKVRNFQERIPSETDLDTLKLLQDFNFETWGKIIISLLEGNEGPKDLENLFAPKFKINTESDVLFNELLDDGFFGMYADLNVIILAILDLVEDKENTHLVLDYSELVDGGYFGQDEELCKDNDLERTVILTEGVSDRRFIQRSLKLLCPHICDYYSFLDFDELNLPGSASALVNTIKAFSAAGIENKMVAVFDNDTAAKSAKKVLNALPVADNIRIITLPILEFLKAYPTVGPQGLHSMDVNGLAGSIELYFEESSLREADGTFVPVIWKGYDESLKQYQGEILKKGEVQKKFEAILKEIESGANPLNYNFNSMTKVLISICGFKFFDTTRVSRFARTPCLPGFS
jgi:hypothetical protein